MNLFKIQRFTLNLLLFSFISSVSNSALAEVVKRLYEVEIPVFSQDRKERNIAIKSGLSELLIRISGRSEVGELLELDDVYLVASKFVQQFSYRKLRNQPESTIENSETEPATKLLWIKYNKKAINNMLRQRKLPVWGQTRPSALVWFAIEKQGRREIIANQPDNIIFNTISNYSKRRGLPIRFPLMDLSDRMTINSSDVWANFEDTIFKASERYFTEAIIVARAFQDFNGDWITRWTLYSNEQQQSWEFRHSEITLALTPAIDHITDNLSVRFTQTNINDDNNEVLFKVSNIQNLSDYTRVLKYLSSIASIIEVQSYEITEDNVIFNLATRSGRIGVAQSVALGRMLVKEQHNIPNVSLDRSFNEQGEINSDTDTINQIIPDLKYRLLK